MIDGLNPGTKPKFGAHPPSTNTPDGVSTMNKV